MSRDSRHLFGTHLHLHMRGATVLVCFEAQGEHQLGLFEHLLRSDEPHSAFTESEGEKGRFVAAEGTDIKAPTNKPLNFTCTLHS